MKTAEYIAVQSENGDILIMGIYRSHHYSAQEFCSELEIFLDGIKAKNFYIIGDININISVASQDSGTYLDLLSCYGLTKGIEIDTRFEKEYSSC